MIGCQSPLLASGGSDLPLPGMSKDIQNERGSQPKEGVSTPASIELCREVKDGDSLSRL